MNWYLARELDYADAPEAKEHWEKYLQMPGGAQTERAYALRMLAKIEPEKMKKHLMAAMLESPLEPEAFVAFAQMAQNMNDWVSALYYARQACSCPAESQTHASDPRCYGPLAPDIASVAASRLGRDREALAYAREAVRRSPEDTRLVANLTVLERKLSEVGPQAA
jgi:hypothetical protein